MQTSLALDLRYIEEVFLSSKVLLKSTSQPQNWRLCLKSEDRVQMTHKHEHKTDVLDLFSFVPFHDVVQYLVPRQQFNAIRDKHNSVCRPRTNMNKIVEIVENTAARWDK